MSTHIAAVSHDEGGLQYMLFSRTASRALQKLLSSHQSTTVPDANDSNHQNRTASNMPSLQFPKAPLGNHIPLFAILISVCLIGLALAHFCIKKKKAPTQKVSPALAARCSDDHDPHNPPEPPLIKTPGRVETTTYDADDELDSEDALFSPLKLSADEAASYTSGEIAKLTGLSRTSESIISSATGDSRALPSLIFAAAVLEHGSVLFSSSPPCPAQINAAAFSNNAHLSHSQSSHAAPPLHGAPDLPQCNAPVVQTSTDHGVLSIATQHYDYKNVSVEAAFH